MSTKLEPEDAEKLKAISKLLSDWRTNRWWVLGIGGVMIASAFALVWSIVQLTLVLFELRVPASFGEDFSREAADYLRAFADTLRMQSNLFLVLALRLITALFSGVLGVSLIAYVIRHWNGSPALRALEVIARRELEAD